MLRCLLEYREDLLSLDLHRQVSAGVKTQILNRNLHIIMTIEHSSMTKANTIIAAVTTTIYGLQPQSFPVYI